MMLDLHSIFAYLLSPLFAVAVIFIFPQVNPKKRALLYLLAFCPICIFAALRGSVGTDTYNYRYFYDSYGTVKQADVDLLFSVFEGFCHWIGLSTQTFLAMQAGFCWFLFSLGAARIDKTLPVLGVGLLPTLMIESTFNTLRVGMAFAVALLVIQVVDKKINLRNVVLTFLPGLFHSSLLLLLVTKARKVWAIAIIVAITGITAFIFSDAVKEFLGLKLFLYVDLEKPGMFSGAWPLFECLMLFFIAKKSKGSFAFGNNTYSLGLTLIAISILGVSFSYAFLRFLQIGLFLLAISVSRAAIIASKDAKIGLLFMGLMSCFNFLRLILGEGAITSSPFLPFRFF